MSEMLTKGFDSLYKANLVCMALPVANTGSESPSSEEHDEQNQVKDRSGGNGQTDQNFQDDLDDHFGIWRKSESFFSGNRPGMKDIVD